MKRNPKLKRIRATKKYSKLFVLAAGGNFASEACNGDAMNYDWKVRSPQQAERQRRRKIRMEALLSTIIPFLRMIPSEIYESGL